MRHLFVINPLAFRGGAEIQQFKSEIVRRLGGEKRFDIMVSRYQRDAVCAVYRYLQKYSGEVRVYAVGGDGILHDCLNGMARFPMAELTSFPYGSEPAFLRSFSANACEAFSRLDALVSARAVPTDVIDMGGRLALNACAIGLPATVGSAGADARAARKPRTGNSRASMAFSLKSVRAVFNRPVRQQQYDVCLDGHSFSGKYASIVISNGPCFYAGKVTAPLAKPNDGMLDIMLIKSEGPFKLISVLPDYFSGKHHCHLDCIIYARASHVEVRSETPIYMRVDGEPLADLRAQISVIPNAVKFAAPEGFVY